MALLSEAMNRLNPEYPQGNATTFETLNVFLEPNNSKELPTYEDVAARLKISLGSVRTLTHRQPKQFTAFVLDEIRCTISDSADVDAEHHDMCEALIAAEGRIMP